MVKTGSVAVVAAGLVLALGGCGADSGTQEEADASGKGATKPTAAPAPSKELVAWLGGMCEATTAIKSLRTDSAADLKGIRNSDEADLTVRAKAVSYLSWTPEAVNDVERDLEDLAPSGIPAADRLRDAWLKKVRGVVTELDGVTPNAAFDDAEGSVADVDKLVQSLTAPKPDLPELTEKDAQLAAAYKNAEQCAPGWRPGAETESPSPDPTGPLPKAADGTDTDACSDGACEVLVTATADITANGVSVRVSVRDEYVTFQTEGAVMQLGGAGGEARFGHRLKATIVAHDKDGAVLKFTTP